MNRSYVRASVPRTLAAAISLAFATCAHAAVVLPTGPVATTGAPTFNVSADTLTMDQVDPSVAVNWSSFSIGAGGTVVFNVPANAASVHNDTSGTVSQLGGTWIGSGNITLHNATGISLSGTYQGIGGSLQLFSDGAINVTGAIRTTGNLGITETDGADLTLQNVHVGGTTTLDVRAHDIDASATSNAFQILSVRARNASIYSSTALIVGLNTSGNANVTSPASVTSSPVGGVSVGGDLTINSGGSIWVYGPHRASNVSVGGKATLNAAGDVTFGADDYLALGQYVEASGQNIYLTGNNVRAGNLTASSQVVLNVGYNDRDIGFLLTGNVNAPLLTVNTVATLADGGSISGDTYLNGTLRVARTTNWSYDGTMTATGSTARLVQVGTGTTLLNGTSLSVPVDVNAGTLLVGDASHASTARVGAVTVAGGAGLGGYGTIAGNLLLSPGSTLLVNASETSASRVSVDGHATITGSHMVINATGTQWGAGKSYVVFSAAGGITGTFASVDSNLAFLDALLTYGSTGDVTLLLRPNTVNFVDVAVTPNQRAVALAATSLGAGHAVYDGLVGLDAASARAAFTSLAGDLHASTKGVVMDSQRQVQDAVTRHLADADLPGGQRADAGRVSTWISVLGRDGEYDGNANAGKVNASGTGLLVGADLAVGESGRVGAVLGHTRENVHDRSVGGSADVQGNLAGIYGDVAFDALKLSGGVVQAHHAIDTRRDVSAGAASGVAYASRDADTTQGFAELGYAMVQGASFRAEPFVQAAVVRWSGDHATERGVDGALVIGSDDAHVTTGRAGVHLGTSLGENSRFGLQATLAWQRAWGDTTPSSHVRFAEGGDAFTTTGAPLARNAGLVDAGIIVRLAPSLRLDASYTGQFAGKASDHGGRVSLNMTF